MTTPLDPSTTDRPSTTGWRLAIDVGTSYTAAASERNGRITTVLFDGSPRIPSVIAIDDLGRLVVAAVAEREMARAPERAERCPKRRIGDPVILLGEVAVRPVDAVAAVLRYVFDEAVHQSGGARPAEVVLTHPARWGSVRLGLLAAAARVAGLPEPVFVSEPVAAAAAESEAAALGDGQLAAVFDLGGGTFDTAVVRRVGAGFEVVGQPGGNDRVGGETFDERLGVAMGELLARTKPDAWENLRYAEERTWRRAAFDFRTAVRSAKEALSTHVDASLYLGAPVDAEMRITRDEFEALVTPDLQVAVGELAATVEAAGITPADLRSVFLVGGSGRIPLASRMVGEWLGRVPVTWGDPKSAVVIGALMLPPTALRSLAVASPTAEMPRLDPPVAAAVSGGAAALATRVLPSQPASALAVAAVHRPGRGRLLVGAALAAVAVVAIGAIALASRDGDGRSGGVTTSGPASGSTLDESAVDTTVAPSTTVDTTTSSTTPPTTSVAPTTSATTITTTLAVTPPGGGSTTTPRTTPTTAAPTTVTAAPTTVATAPPTAPPTAPTTAAPTTVTAAPTTAEVPYVIDVDTSTARSAIVNQRGFAGMSIVAGSCDSSSIVTGYMPTGTQPLSSTITVWCN